MTTTPSTASQPEHETIVRQGDTLTCTACGTSANAASQAPAVSIDSEEFRELLGKMYGRTSFNYLRPNKETQAVIAHIDAKLAQVAQDKTDYANQLIEDCRKLRDRATAAEAKLEAIRQGAEGLQEYSPAFKVIGGMAKSNDGGWLCKEELLALLQPHPKADESGLPG